MRRLEFKLIMLLLVFTGSAWAQQSSLSVVATIDASKPGAEINPNIYGQFAEHLGRGIYGGLWVGEQSSIPNIRGYRKDVVEALQKLQVPVVRWPGGCFADQYDWRDGIGARDRRPERITPWGARLKTMLSVHMSFWTSQNS